MFYLAVYKTWLLKHYLIDLIEDLRIYLICIVYQICKLRIFRAPKISDLNNRIFVFNEIYLKSKLAPKLYRFDKVFLTFNGTKITSITFDYLSVINTIEYFKVDFERSQIKDVYFDQEINRNKYYDGVSYDDARFIA